MMQNKDKNDRLSDILFRIARYVSNAKYDLARIYSVETGFPIKHVINDLDSILSLILDLRTYYNDLINNILPTGRTIHLPPKYVYANSKYIKIIMKPYNNVLIVLPLNAVLPYAINLPLYAFTAGVNSVHVYLSRRTPNTNSYIYMLYSMMRDAGLNIYHVNIEPKNLSNYAKSKNIDLIHYFGSARYIPQILSEAFNHGINVIYEGEGFNIGIMLARELDEKYIDLIIRSSLKYNGMVCSRVHIYFVNSNLYDSILKTIKDKLDELNVNDDPTSLFTDIGPINYAIYSNYTSTVKNLRGQGAVIYGEPNCKELPRGDRYLCNPLLIDISNLTSLPHEEITSPIILIKNFRSIDEIIDFITKRKIFNVQILTDDNNDIMNQIVNIIQATRIVINTDPTIESPYLPWGGISKHGNTGAVFWIEKYTYRSIIESIHWDDDRKIAYAIEVLGPYRPVLRKIKIPRINDGYLVEVLASGICGTDKALIRGEYNAPYPVIPGHENVGRVIEVHSKSSNIDEGDIIIWGANIPCGKCEHCLKGLDKYCPYMIEYGLSISSSIEPYLWGGWSTHAYVPSSAYIYKLKSKVDPSIMVLAEPYACTYSIKQYITRYCTGKGKEDDCNILVIGSGTLALLTLIRLWYLQMSEHRRMNVHSLIKYKELYNLFSKYSNKIYMLDNGDTIEPNSYDIIVDAVGTGESIGKALLYAEPGAIILMLGGYNSKPLQIDNKKLLFDKDLGITFLSAYDRRAFISSVAEFESMTDVHDSLKDYIEVVNVKYNTYASGDDVSSDLTKLILTRSHNKVKRIIKIEE